MHKKGISISFFDRDSRFITEKLLTSIALKEDQLIKKSMEFFDDPEPCMIHKSAIMNRLYSEIEEFFLAHTCGASEKVEWLDIPLCCREYMDIPGDIAFVLARQVGK